MFCLACYSETSINEMESIDQDIIDTLIHFDITDYCPECAETLYNLLRNVAQTFNERKL